MTMMAEKIRNIVARTIPIVMASMVAGRWRTDGKASLRRTSILIIMLSKMKIRNS